MMKRPSRGRSQKVNPKQETREKKKTEKKKSWSRRSAASCRKETDLRTWCATISTPICAVHTTIAEFNV